MSSASLIRWLKEQGGGSGLWGVLEQFAVEDILTALYQSTANCELINSGDSLQKQRLVNQEIRQSDCCQQIRLLQELGQRRTGWDIRLKEAQNN